MGRPEIVREGAMRPAAPTPGIDRREAFASEGVWAGVARTEPRVVSGWHHHGDHTTYLYVVSGRLRLESGPAGREVLEGVSGDFIRIPPRAVHRESNPEGRDQHIVVVRVGGGPVVVNVDGPDPG